MNNNRLFVANKPNGISCNSFLSKIKHKYGVKKAGFSGTLDPFATGCLIIAFNQYTKLFNYLKKTPKTYIATLHLGAKSESLDVEKVEKIFDVDEVSMEKLDKITRKLTSTLTYLPPKYSAKKINGKRAYEFARANEDVKLNKITTTIYNLHVREYSHPFVTFEVTLSEGGYVRSIGKMISDELGVDGSLSMLERVCEGEFKYENEKALNPLNFLNLNENFYMQDKNDILLGRALKKSNFKICEDGEYYILIDNFFSIIKIIDNEVIYKLNRIEL